MEETKERFELFGKNCIKDNNPDARCQLLDAYVACVILNEQDKKIKAKEKEANTYAKEIVFLDNKIKLLKQSQKQLAIEVLGKTREKFGYKYNSQLVISSKYLCDFIDNQIKELKGEETISFLQQQFNEKGKIEEQLEELKQQLAEKDKELSEYVKIVDDLHKQLSDKCDFCDKTKDQDKISFALEQLEKVKEWLEPKYFDNEQINYLTKIIDNQIKSLKGEE